MLEFFRFPTPHYGDTKSIFLFEMLLKSNILWKLRAITTDNASRMLSAISKLTNMMKIRKNKLRMVGDVHVKCIAHVVSVEVKECLTDIQKHVY